MCLYQYGLMVIYFILSPIIQNYVIYFVAQNIPALVFGSSFQVVHLSDAWHCVWRRRGGRLSSPEQGRRPAVALMKLAHGADEAAGRAAWMQEGQQTPSHVSETSGPPVAPQVQKVSRRPRGKGPKPGAP